MRPVAAHEHRHSRDAVRLEPWLRWLIYAVLAALWLSGLLWLFGPLLAADADGFAPVSHPLISVALKLHGGCAMLGLFVIGSLWHRHMRAAHSRRRNRVSGHALLALLAALVVSGYALYYLASEQSRPLWSGTHWVIGLLLPLALLLHVWHGRRRR